MELSEAHFGDAGDDDAAEESEMLTNPYEPSEISFKKLGRKLKRKVQKKLQLGPMGTGNTTKERGKQWDVTNKTNYKGMDVVLRAALAQEEGRGNVTKSFVEEQMFEGVRRKNLPTKVREAMEDRAVEVFDAIRGMMGQISNELSKEKGRLVGVQATEGITVDTLLDEVGTWYKSESFLRGGLDPETKGALMAFRDQVSVEGGAVTKRLKMPNITKMKEKAKSVMPKMSSSKAEFGDVHVQAYERAAAAMSTGKPLAGLDSESRTHLDEFVTHAQALLHGREYARDNSSSVSDMVRATGKFVTELSLGDEDPTGAMTSDELGHIHNFAAVAEAGLTDLGSPFNVDLYNEFPFTVGAAHLVPLADGALEHEEYTSFHHALSEADFSGRLHAHLSDPGEAEYTPRTSTVPGQAIARWTDAFKYNKKESREAIWDDLEEVFGMFTNNHYWRRTEGEQFVELGPSRTLYYVGDIGMMGAKLQKSLMIMVDGLLTEFERDAATAAKGAGSDSYDVRLAFRKHFLSDDFVDALTGDELQQVRAAFIGEPLSEAKTRFPMVGRFVLKEKGGRDLLGSPLSKNLTENPALRTTWFALYKFAVLGVRALDNARMVFPASASKAREIHRRLVEAIIVATGDVENMVQRYNEGTRGEAAERPTSMRQRKRTAAEPFRAVSDNVDYHDLTRNADDDRALFSGSMLDKFSTGRDADTEKGTGYLEPSAPMNDWGRYQLKTTDVTNRDGGHAVVKSKGAVKRGLSQIMESSRETTEVKTHRLLQYWLATLRTDQFGLFSSDNAERVEGTKALLKEEGKGVSERSPLHNSFQKADYGRFNEVIDQMVNEPLRPLLTVKRASTTTNVRRVIVAEQSKIRDVLTQYFGSAFRGYNADRGDETVFRDGDRSKVTRVLATAFRLYTVMRASETYYVHQMFDAQLERLTDVVLKGRAMNVAEQSQVEGMWTDAFMNLFVTRGGVLAYEATPGVKPEAGLTRAMGKLMVALELEIINDAANVPLGAFSEKASEAEQKTFMNQVLEISYQQTRQSEAYRVLEAIIRRDAGMLRQAVGGNRELQGLLQYVTAFAGVETSRDRLPALLNAHDSFHAYLRALLSMLIELRINASKFSKGSHLLELATKMSLQKAKSTIMYHRGELPSIAWVISRFPRSYWWSTAVATQFRVWMPVDEDEMKNGLNRLQRPRPEFAARVLDVPEEARTGFDISLPPPGMPQPGLPSISSTVDVEPWEPFVVPESGPGIATLSDVERRLSSAFDNGEGLFSVPNPYKWGKRKYKKWKDKQKGKKGGKDVEPAEAGGVARFIAYDYKLAQFAMSNAATPQTIRAAVILLAAVTNPHQDVAATEDLEALNNIVIQQQAVVLAARESLEKHMKQKGFLPGSEFVKQMMDLFDAQVAEQRVAFSKAITAQKRRLQEIEPVAEAVSTEDEPLSKVKLAGVRGTRFRERLDKDIQAMQALNDAVTVKAIVDAIKMVARAAVPDGNIGDFNTVEELDKFDLEMWARFKGLHAALNLQLKNKGMDKKAVTNVLDMFSKEFQKERVKMRLKLEDRASELNGVVKIATETDLLTHIQPPGYQFTIDTALAALEKTVKARLLGAQNQDEMIQAMERLAMVQVPQGGLEHLTGVSDVMKLSYAMRKTSDATELRVAALFSKNLVPRQFVSKFRKMVDKEIEKFAPFLNEAMMSLMATAEQPGVSTDDVEPSTGEFSPSEATPGLRVPSIRLGNAPTRLRLMTLTAHQLKSIARQGALNLRLTLGDTPGVIDFSRAQDLSDVDRLTRVFYARKDYVWQLLVRAFRDGPQTVHEQEFSDMYEMYAAQAEEEVIAAVEARRQQIIAAGGGEGAVTTDDIDSSRAAFVPTEAHKDRYQVSAAYKSAKKTLESTTDTEAIRQALGAMAASALDDVTSVSAARNRAELSRMDVYYFLDQHIRPVYPEDADALQEEYDEKVYANLDSVVEELRAAKRLTKMYTFGSACKGKANGQPAEAAPGHQQNYVIPSEAEPGKARVVPPTSAEARFYPAFVTGEKKKAKRTLVSEYEVEYFDEMMAAVFSIDQPLWGPKDQVVIVKPLDVMHALGKQRYHWPQHGVTVQYGGEIPMSEEELFVREHIFVWDDELGFMSMAPHPVALHAFVDAKHVTHTPAQLHEARHPGRNVQVYYVDAPMTWMHSTYAAVSGAKGFERRVYWDPSLTTFEHASAPALDVVSAPAMVSNAEESEVWAAPSVEVAPEAAEARLGFNGDEFVMGGDDYDDDIEESEAFALPTADQLY